MRCKQTKTRNIVLTNVRCKQTKTRNIVLTNVRRKQTKNNKWTTDFENINYFGRELKENRSFLNACVYTPCGGRFYSDVLGEKNVSLFRIEVGRDRAATDRNS